MSQLSDGLRFALLRQEKADGSLQTLGMNPTLPSQYNWVAVPRDDSALAFIYHANELQCVVDEFKVLFRTPLPVANAMVLDMAASGDGRMVAIACHSVNDSNSANKDEPVAPIYVYCYNVTSEGGFDLRYTYPLPASLERSPRIQAMAFGANHTLAVIEGIDNTLHLVQNHGAGVVVHTSATSVSFAPDGSHMAVGLSDGKIEIYKATVTENLSLLSTWQFPTAEPPCPCTHVDWISLDVLVAGYCRVTPIDDQPDLDDEYEAADHEALMLLYQMQEDFSPSKEYTDLGNVVPFFGVPKGGRHKFFTACLKEKLLLLVATNLAHEIKALIFESGEWSVVDVPEGEDMQCSTDENDEFTFPIGLGFLVSGGKPRALLASTAGSVSTYQIAHEQQPDYFDLPIMEPILPQTAVPMNAHVTTPVPAVSTSVFALSSEPLPAPQLSASNFTASPATSTGFGQGQIVLTTVPSDTSLATDAQSGATEFEQAPLSFGSGTTAPSFNFGSSAGKALSLGVESTSLKASAAFNIFQKGTEPSGSLMAKPLFGSPKDTADEEAAKLPSPEDDLSDVGLKAALVFDSFDNDKNGRLPLSMLESLVGELGEGFYGNELEVQTGLIDANDSGLVERSAFIAWYQNLIKDSKKQKNDDSSLDSDELADRAEEAENARRAFMIMAIEENGIFFVRSSQFEALVESMGTTYCAEQHGRALRHLEKDGGRICLDDYVSWYIRFLFDDEDHDSDSDTSTNEIREVAVSVASPTAGWGDRFETDPDRWKCESCMVFNNSSSTKCVACQNRRPGIQGEAIATTSSAPVAAFSSSIGPKGFTFGETANTDSSTTFAAGPSSVFTSNALLATPIGGFAFQTEAPASSNILDESMRDPASALADPLLELPGKIEITSATPPTSTSESSMVVAAKASAVFDSFDKQRSGSLPLSLLKDLIDELGEGFHGDQLNKQAALIDIDGLDLIGRDSFIAWYQNYVKDSAGHRRMDGDSSDSDEQAERAEETENARRAFMAISSEADGSQFIQSSQFEALMLSMGTTYCVEQHGRALKRLERDGGRIYLDDYVAWYLSYIFDDDDDDDLDATSDTIDEEQIALPEANHAAGWGNLFEAGPGSWKCGSCMILNTPSVNKCAACKTPRQGFQIQDDTSANVTLNPVTLSSIGPQGFTFGETTTAAPPSAFTLTGSQSATSTASSGSQQGAGFRFVAPVSAIDSPVLESGSGKQTEVPEDVVGIFKEISFPAASASPPMDHEATSSFSSVEPIKSATALSLPTSDKNGPAAVQKSKTTPSASAYPPMNYTAPKPFGSVESTKATRALSPPISEKNGPVAIQIPKTTPSASAYPPMNYKAPTPFGSVESTKTSTAFSLPISDKNAPATVQKSPPSASTYPPMNCKAPTPFGSVESTKATTISDMNGLAAVQNSKATPFASTYPPMNYKSPTPFGSVDRTKVVEVASAYTPNEYKSPMPSGSVKPVELTSVVSRQNSSHAVGGQHITASLDSLARSPTPFGFCGLKLTSDPVGFSSKSGVALSAGILESTDKSVSHKSTAAKSRPTDEHTLFGTASGRHELAQSRTSLLPEGDCTRQFANICRAIAEERAVLAEDFPFVEWHFEKNGLEVLTRELNQLIHLGRELSDSVLTSKQQAALIIGKKNECLRRLSECQFVLDTLENDHSSGPDFLLTQPLDLASEDRRRLFISQSMLVDKYVKLVRGRLGLLADLDKGRGAEYILCYVLNAYDNLAVSKKEITRMLSFMKLQIDGLDLNDHTARFSSGPLLPANISAKKIKAQAKQKWAAAEDVVQQLSVPDVKFLPCRSSAGVIQWSATLSQASLTRRKMPSRATPILSPQLPVRLRADWVTQSTVDQDKASRSIFAPPHKLTQTSINAAGESALESFGTTSLKATDALDVIRRGIADPQVAAASLKSPPRPPLSRDSLASPSPGSNWERDRDRISVSRKSSRDEESDALPAMLDTVGVALLKSHNVTARTERSSISLSNSMANGRRADASSIDKTSPIRSFGQGNYAPSPNATLSEKSHDVGAAEKASVASPQKYVQLLTEFYQKNNLSKVGEVHATLEKYKDKEAELFEKLSKKYGVNNPLPPVERGLESSAGSMFSNNVTSTLPSFGTIAPSQLPPAYSPFGKPSPASSPYAMAPALPPSFGTTSPARQSPLMKPLGFDAAPSNSLFAQTSHNSIASPSPLFAAASPSQIGTPQQAPDVAASTNNMKLANQSNDPRQMLTAFYTQFNKDKVADVDKLLVKYQGNHEAMFRILAKKYHQDPSVFGLSAETPVAYSNSVGFGQPSTLGGTLGSTTKNASPFGNTQSGLGQMSAAAGFNQTPAFGHGTTPTSISGAAGFGSTTPLGGGLFGLPSTPASATGSGMTSPGGFGSSGYSSTPAPSFGSLASGSQPPFGGSPGPTFSSPFGGNASATPFGAPRR